MKKFLLCIFVLFLSITLCCCTVILGGKNRRNIGETMFLFTDGNKEYLKYSLSYYEKGYVEISETGFKIVDEDLKEVSLTETQNDAETIVSGVYLEYFGEGFECKQGYEYLSEQIFENVGECKNFECIILKKGNEIYGAINCYKRASGRSGNLLSNEELDKSYLISVENQKIKIEKELKKTAVLAVNQSHYIAYKDKKFYSVSKENDNKIEICKDLWWDRGPTFFSYVDVYFSDDVFMIFGNKRTHDDSYITFIVGNIDGKCIETFIDNRKAE